MEIFLFRKKPVPGLVVRAVRVSSLCVTEICDVKTPILQGGTDFFRYRFPFTLRLLG